MMDSSIPGMVYVTDAQGRAVATINPLTRERKDVDGNLEHTLSLQGWSLTGAKTIAWPGHGKPEKPLAPIERDRGGRIIGRDGRAGHGGLRTGSGRKRKGA